MNAFVAKEDRMNFRMKVLGVTLALVVSCVALRAASRVGLLSGQSNAPVLSGSLQTTCNDDIGSSACGGSDKYRCPCNARSHTMRCPNGSTVEVCKPEDFCQQTNCKK